MKRSLLSRVEVVGPAFAVGTFLSGLAATSGRLKMGWGFGSFLEVWLSPLAGPFAGLWATANWSLDEAVFWGVVLSLAIAAHPLWPGRITGVISASGLALWVLLGFMFTYDGV